jgi:solute:Na+ symporter, SSS family
MIDAGVVIVYLAGILLLGLWAGRGMKNLGDFSVAGRSYGSLVIFATLSASFIGGGFSVGNAEKVFLFGVANIVALWGFSLKEILVAKIIAPRMTRFPQAISVGDIMAVDYGKTGKVVAGVFAVMLCAGIVGAQVSAMGYIFNALLGLDRTWGILIGFSIVITYSTMGGMKAVIMTDIVQFLILAVGLPLALVLGIEYAGGLDAVMEATPQAHLAVPALGTGWIPFLSLFLVFILGETLVPPYVQRLCIGRNVDEVARGTLYSGLFSIPFFAVTGSIGLVALAIDPSLEPNLAMPFVVITVMPVVLKGIVIAGLLSVVMSSADSFLNSAAVALVNDVVKPLKASPLSEARELSWARLTTLGVGAGAVFFALSIESVIDILIYAYNFWSPILLAPLVATILGFGAGPKSLLAGGIAGVGGTLIWNQALGGPMGIDGMIVGIAANLIVFVATSRWERAQESA